jgi:RNA polymerase sigma-70 factor (ECF subfamily)
MSDLDAYLSAIAAGDADAFERWLAGAEPRIRLSLRSFAAYVDTEAVLQETLLRVWQLGPHHAADGRPDSLVRLGVRIARNLAVDELRRARLQPADVDDLERMMERLVPAAGRAGGAAPDPLLRRLIETCRRALRGKPAEALDERLRSGGAEPDEVLAVRLGMRLNTFLQNVTRARKLLAECLQKRHVDLDAELA